MMGGFGMFMSIWIPLLVLFWIVVIAVISWMLIRWLSHRQIPPSPSEPSLQQERPYESQPYEQGYQLPSQPPQTEGTYQEGGTRHSLE